MREGMEPFLRARAMSARAHARVQSITRAERHEAKRAEIDAVGARDQRRSATIATNRSESLRWC
jgi:hypothetical protein